MKCIWSSTVRCGICTGGREGGFVARLSWRLVFFFLKMDGRVDG